MGQALKVAAVCLVLVGERLAVAEELDSLFGVEEELTEAEETADYPEPSGQFAAGAEYDEPSGATFEQLSAMSDQLEAVRIAKEAAALAAMPDVGITHEDVMAAAEGVAEAREKSRYVHDFRWRDLAAGGLRDEIDANPSANAFALYFHKPSCEHCVKFSPVLSEAVSDFEDRYDEAEVHWLGVNADTTEFGDIGSLYDIVEFPTIMLLKDMYSEPAKYRGGWGDSAEVADYVAAFADAHACDRVSGVPAVDLAPGSVRVAIGDEMSPSGRAVAYVEAVAARKRYAVERDVRIVCGGAGDAVTVQRNFDGEAAEVLVEVPAEGDDARKRSVAEIARERLRRAVVPAITEVTSRGDYNRHLKSADAVGIVHFRPDATNATIRKTLRDARRLAADANETTSLRLVYCRMDAPDLDAAANYLCAEMAQYTLPRFNTSGGVGFALVDFGVRPEKPTLCEVEVERDADENLTPHMKMILKEQEKRRMVAYAAYGNLRKFALYRSFNRKAAADFLSEYVAGTIKEAFLSDAIPETHQNPGPFFMLVGDTFESFVDTSDDVLVYIVQAECWACHQLFPTVHSVVELLSDFAPRMKFASIDNRANDILVRPWDNVDATPAILFLPGGGGPEDVIKIDYKISADAKGEDRAILSAKTMAQVIVDAATHPFTDREGLDEELTAMAHSA